MKLIFNVTKQALVIEHHDHVNEIKRCLSINTSQVSFNYFNEKNYSEASDISMKFTNYQNLVKKLERQCLQISKNNLINVKLQKNDIEFVTLSETNNQGSISFDEDDNY